ncbi:flagellar motor switch phosphatase FliY [Syntrophomonas erecta]
MNDGILSQEEIDALLKGDSLTPAKSNSIELTDFEKDTLGEIGNISMGTSATTLSTLLRKKVSITTPNVVVIDSEQLRSDYPLPYVMVEVQYREGLNGTNVLVIKEEDACIIANLMMGGEGVCDQDGLSEMELSAVGEAMNQMMGSATTSLSSMFNRRIDIEPPKLTTVDLGRDRLELASNYDEMVSIRFKMEIENLVNSEIMQIIPIEAVRNMIDALMGNTMEVSSREDFKEQEESGPSLAPEPASSPILQADQGLIADKQDKPTEPQDVWGNENYREPSSGIKKSGQYTVQPVQFTNLQPQDTVPMPQNIGLIMDVPLSVTVELGKTRKTIGEILDLHQGAIIQLDKMAGETVDLLVNGKLIAKGEVVVIDENYGIRITTIISPMDRMNKLQ